MTSYKLTYFNATARGEVARMLLSFAGQEFEDYRVDESDWPKLKQTIPFGRMPVLEMDGVQLFQSNAFTRYLAIHFGYAGESAMDRYRADMVVDFVGDILYDFLPTVTDIKTINVREDLKHDFAENKLPIHMYNLETILQQNKDGDGFFVGDNLTWADLTVYNWLMWFHDWDITPPFDKTPKLEALLGKVENHPKVAEWLSKRPKQIIRGKCGRECRSNHDSAFFFDVF